MKKIFIALLLLCSIHLNAQIKVMSNGNVGIGTNVPEYKADIQGIMRMKAGWTGVICGWSSNDYCPAIFPEEDNYLWLGRPDRKVNHMWIWALDVYDGMYKISDRNVKENIKSISNVLTEIDKVNVYSFNYKDEYCKNFTREQKDEQPQLEYGVLAQELKEIFPNLVKESDSGLMSVNYVGLIPILIQAIKDLRLELDSVKQSISIINTEGIDLFKKSSNNNIDASNVPNSTDVGVLYQNSPNPFSNSTNINFYIPYFTIRANIYIYDMNGKQIKVYPVTSKGNGTIKIDGNELEPGIYLYTLITDGKEVATKKMILTN